MAITYNRRCGLCGQFMTTDDREALLEEHRFEWSEAIVDDFIAGNRHFCVDTDPHGARESARLIEAGLMRPQLDWLIAAELERRQAVPLAGWVTLGSRRRRLAALIVAALVVACILIGAGYGVRAATDHPAACHSVTEDSAITDCDYSHGAWTPKR